MAPDPQGLAGEDRAAAVQVDPRETAEALGRLVAEQPFGLFTDFDGTISQISPTPADATISPRAAAALQALGRLALVTVVSGRTLVDLRRMVGLRNVAYVGSHGLATWIEGVEEWDGSVRPYLRFAAQAAAELAPLRRLDGVLFEEKGTGIAIHYRLTRRPEEARASIMRAIAASGSAAHFDLLEGVRMVELRPRLSLNKGTAVRSLVERFGLRSALYVGDDLTDVEAFEALRDLRRSGAAAGLCIAARNAEASPLVEASADYAVDGVEGVEQLLEYLLRLLRGSR